MPIPLTKIKIVTALSSGNANRLIPTIPGDFSNVLTGSPVAAWVSAIGDLNGDGIAEIVIGAGSADNKALDAGRIIVHRGQSTGGTTTTLTTDVNDIDKTTPVKPYNGTRIINAGILIINCVNITRNIDAIASPAPLIVPMIGKNIDVIRY